LWCWCCYQQRGGDDDDASCADWYAGADWGVVVNLATEDVNGFFELLAYVVWSFLYCFCNCCCLLNGEVVFVDGFKDGGGLFWCCCFQDR